LLKYFKNQKTIFMKKYFLLLLMFVLAISGYSQTVVLSEGFETPPYAFTSSGSPTWGSVTNLYYEGTHSFRNTVGASATSYLTTTNSFSTTGNSYVELTFAHICKIEVADTAYIEVSVDGGTTWQKLTTTEYEGSGSLQGGYAFNALSYNPDWQPLNPSVAPTNTWWKVETFNISSIAANQSNVNVRFVMKDGNATGSGGAAGWYLDDIKVTIASSELTPPTITLLSPIYQDTVLNNPGPYTIKATITDASGLHTARMIWSINGGAADSVNMTNTSGSTYEATIPAQAYNTHIDYTIKAIDNSPANNVATLSKWFYTKRELLQDITIGTGTSTTSYLPLYGYYDYTYGGIIYEPSEINYTGLIKKIQFYVGNTPNNYTTDDQIIYMGEVANTEFTSTSLIDTVGLTRVKDPFSYTWDGGGWKEFTLTTPFNYSGNNSLLIVWVNKDGSGGSGYPTFRYTTKTYGGLYKYQNTTYPSIPGTGTRTSSRPNIQISFEIPTNDNDVQFVAITEPSGVLYSTNQYDIKGNFKNLGDDTLTSFTIKYKINGVEQTPYNWTGTMLTDEEREITFATGVSFTAGSVEIEAWTESPNGVVDENPSNDTIIVNLHCCTAGFAGTYTIDSSQPTGGTNFNSVLDAFTEISTCGMVGPVTIELVDTLYQGSIIIGELPGLSPTNTLTIKPQNGKQVTIASDATYYTIQLLSTHDIIIDGSGDGSGSRDLTIKHTATSGSHAPIHIASAGVGQGSERIIIKNVNIKAGHNAATTSGIFIGGETSATASGYDNDSIVINNVHISKAYYGVYSYGNSADPNKRVYVTNSVIGADSTADYIYKYGIYYYYSTDGIINNNTIYNIIGGSSYIAGVYAYTGSVRNTITNNNIYSIKYTGTSGYGGWGIAVNTGNATSDVLIANNMIRDLQGDGYSSITGSSMCGIMISGSTGGIKVYFNSVNLFGNYTRSTATITAGFFAYSNASDLDVRNNIFVNSMINTDNTDAKAYAIYSLAPSSSFTKLDYNDYYVSGVQGVLGYFNSEDQTSLASLRAATGKDVHSLNVDPLFISDYDLHTYNIDLFGAGAPITGITTDIDGDPRQSTPSIGADEVELLPVNLKLLSIDNNIHGCEYSGNTPVSFTVINLGTDPITTFDATYILDGQSPITQTFTTNLSSLDTLQFTFSTNITLDPSIEHNLLVYVSCANDGDRSNDTLDIMISDVHDFIASLYTMSFEETEPYRYFSLLDIGNDGNKWIFPSYGTSNAHSGSYSAVYINSTMNTHGDWLFSRCFEMTAGETYEVSFWYKASSSSDNHVMYLGISPTPNDTINLINIDNISAINNTTYTQHTKRFIAPNTGTYYIGWGMYSPHANNRLYLDDINISWVPSQDVELLEVISPVSDCGLGDEHVTVKGKNKGTTAISNFSISYQIAGSPTVVTETYIGTVSAEQVFTYTFTHTEDFSAPIQDLDITIIVWADLASDPIAYNDTVEYSFISRFTPVEPIVHNETILIGTSATLTAYNEAPDAKNIWYSDYLGNNIIGRGHTYTTPILTDTTVYYVQATSQSDPIIIGNMNSTTTTYYMPFYGYYQYTFSSMIYLADEINENGLIDTIAFYLAGTAPSNFLMDNQTIYMTETTLTEHPTTAFPDTTTMQKVFHGDLIFNGNGWHKIALDTPYDYSGVNNLQIVWINEKSTGSTSGYPYFMRSDVSEYRGLYNYSSTSMPTTGTRLLYLPNIRITMRGCSSGIVTDTVFVVDSTDYELAIDDVIFPENMSCVTPNTNISIRLRNDGYEDIPAGVNLSCIVNGTTLTGTTTEPIFADGTINYTFTTPYNINFVEGQAILDFKVYHSAPQYSLTVFNDTLLKSITVYYQPEAPIAHSCVTLAGLPALLYVDPQPQTSHYWFSDPLGEILLHSGDTFMTPVLYDTTIYYVSTSTYLDPIIVGNMSSTTTTYYMPFYGYYKYTFGSMIYLADEIGQSGKIDNISFFLAGTAPSNFLMDNQKIYIKETTLSEHPTTQIPDTTTMQRVFHGDLIFDGSGWYTIALDSSFDYSGLNNLQIVWINQKSVGSTSGYPYFKKTDVGGYRGLYNYNNTSMPTTGTRLTYVPNIRFNIRGCSSTIVPDTAYVLPSAQYELAINEIVSPNVDDCSQPITNVTVKLHNYGEEPIPAGIELTCIVNGTSTITEFTNNTLLPDEDFYFTFTNPINITYVNGVANVNLKIYHSGYPNFSVVQYNDTIEKTLRLYERAASPIIASSTINFGDVDTLVAVSPSGLPIYWYSDPYGSNVLNVGNSLITPHLLDTTIYYLSAGSYLNTGFNEIIVGNMSSTTTTYYMPFYGYYKYTFSSMIYLADEIRQSGNIDTIAFFLAGTAPSNYLMDNQKIYIKETTLAENPNNLFPDTASMQMVFHGDLIFDGSGWFKIALQTPFNYSGVNNLQIVWINEKTGSSVSGYPYFKRSDVTGNRGLYYYSSTSMPTTGTLLTYVPNIRFSISGCSSELVSDTVYVINFPQYELSVQQLMYPIHNECTNENVNIKVRLHNYGYDTIPAGASITCVMDGTNTITDITSEEILPGSDYIFTFVPQLTIPFVGGQATIDLEIYPTDQTYSVLTYNDTLRRTLTLGLQPEDPIAINDTVPLLMPATLTATHQPGTQLLWYVDPLATNPFYIGDTLITDPIMDTLEYYISAASGSPYVRFTEVTLWKAATTGVTPAYPPYLPTTDLDLLEITNLGDMSINLQNYTLIVEGEGARTYTFPSITLDGGDIMIINIGSGTDDFANLYLNTGGSNNTILSTEQSGFILKDEMNNIVDVVAVNGYTFSPASGVTPSDWSGSIPSATSKAGVIRVVADNNTADDWIVSSATNPQSIGYMNPYFTGTFGSGCQSNRVPIYAYPIYPPYELAVEELLAPTNNVCIEMTTEVTVRLHNYGIDTIPSGVEIICILNTTDTITGTTVEDILPNSTIDFTFPTLLAIPFIGGQASVELEVYHNNPAYSSIATNDTIKINLDLLLQPDAPITTPITVNYGDIATIIPQHQPGTTLFWYTDSITTSYYHMGDTLITNHLTDTLHYYVSAATGAPYVRFTEVTLWKNATNGVTPNYPSYLPTSDLDLLEITNLGDMSVNLQNYTLIVEGVGARTYTFPSITLDGGDIMIVNIGSGTDDFANLYLNTGGSNNSILSTNLSGFILKDEMNNIVDVVAVNGYAFSPTSGVTPSDWSGSIPSASSKAGVIRVVADNNTASDWIVADATNPQSIGYMNPYFTGTFGSGCQSNRVHGVVYIDNIPTIDVGIVEITKPNTGIELTDDEPVKVVIRNFTFTDLINATFDVVYKVDNQPPVVEQFTGSILAHDTASFTFTQTADLSIIGNTYTITAFTEHTLDNYSFNDTLQKTITNNPLEYCTSAATSTADEDICRVKVGDFENISGYTSAKYTDFTNLDGPILFIGEEYDVEVDECDEISAYYAGYARVFIDWNHDGIYQVPGEVVLESYYPNTSYNTLIDTFTVPTNAYIGYTGMRVIVKETSIPDPCGTYTYGETEDYLVLVLPRKAIDAGISAANVGYVQYNGTTTTAEVKVRNYGYNPLTNFEIITKKDAQVISTTPWSGNLLPDASILINITNLPVDSGLNNVCFTVQTLNDSVPQNDTRCIQYFGLPSVILFEDDMEPTTTLTADATGMWEHGVPQGTVINQAYSAPNVWMTKLASPYPNDTVGYLEFPVQNFSGVTNPYLSFYYWVESEDGKDGAYIEYSLNNGQTWLTLGGIDDADGYHWYTDYLANGKPGYSGSSNGWVGAFINMSALSNKTNVKLRIAFVSDATVNADGFAIDNIVISAYNVPNNVALTEIVTPTSPTTTGSTQTVKVKIANVGTNVVTNVPVSYKVDNGTAVNGTYSGSINPGDTVDYTFTQTYQAPHIDYTLCAYTRYPSDIVRINDTLCMNIHSLPADYDIGVVEIITPRDSTPIGQQITVTIAVKNYGLNPVSNIPVRYQLNYANDRNDVINRTINPGDTIHFTFSQKYNGPSMQYILCAETQLSNDMYTSNDALCQVLGTYVVGIEDILAENDGIVIYPNPSTGELNILLETTKTSEGILIVRNPLGELVYSENISVNAGRNELRLDLTHQAAGLYHCTVMLGDKVYNRVISIQR
jgi:hypothetical protein